MTPRKIWTDKCEAARGIKENFGTENALKYLIGEKFLEFLAAAVNMPLSDTRTTEQKSLPLLSRSRTFSSNGKSPITSNGRGTGSHWTQPLTKTMRT